VALVRTRPSDRLKRGLRRFLAAFGLEVYRKGKVRDLADVLEHVTSLGFKPATVIDVGAAGGTVPLYDAFPRARHILLEPLVWNSSPPLSG
jgi:hypothetical protein